MASTPPVPQEFGKYQIIDRIASGGMAELFKARIDGPGGFHKPIAIKRILPNHSANPEFVDMLVDEAKIAGLLSHANIVQILDLGAIDGQYYIAMEYVDGRDLGKLLDRCAEKGITLPVPHAVYVLLEILKGLEYAHNRQVQRGGRPVPLNIVHRDISPGNVLVSFQGEVKLTDFGIAKASVKALETMSGVIKGRFDYMSPEQASGAGADPRSDIFSAGILFYQLLTGTHPFRQQGELQTMEAIRRGEYVPPSHVNSDVPPALEAAVGRALAVEPDERFQTATSFKESLDRFFHDAGFIFSASTLGAFVRGLFPESDPKLARSTPVRPAPRPGGDPQDTGLQDVGSLLRNLPALPTGATPAGFGEESTIIRPGMVAPPQVWSEAETVIRPDALQQLQSGLGGAPTIPLPGPSKASASPAPPIAPMGRNDAPTVELSALTKEFQGGKGRGSADPAARGGPPAQVPSAAAYARPDSRPPGKRGGIVYRTPSHVHVIYVVVCFAALALGLLVGVLLGSARSGGAQEGVLVRENPMVKVHFPDNAKVSVGGRSVPGISPVTATIAAEAPTKVVVELADGKRVETELTLGYNEMRVLVLTPVPHPAPAAPK